MSTPDHIDSFEAYSPAGGDHFDALQDFNTDVTQADLTKYTVDQLEGRRDHYQREWLFERDHAARTACKVELERTEGELNRRKMYRVREAERVFA